MVGADFGVIPFDFSGVEAHCSGNINYKDVLMAQWWQISLIQCLCPMVSTLSYLCRVAQPPIDMGQAQERRTIFCVLNQLQTLSLVLFLLFRFFL